MEPNFSEHARTWETLGRDDPMWAVVSHADKRGGRWEPGEFFRTGVADVDRYQRIFAKLTNIPSRFRKVLDFGCGVGRLSRAWKGHAEEVVGIDVSEAMVEQARRFNHDLPAIQFIANTRPDLACLDGCQFDLVFSHICLQHMAWDFTRRYIGEFHRVCAPGGFVAFQLPARQIVINRGAVIRKRIVDALPLGLGAAYRKRRRGAAAVFEMHYTPVSTVLAWTEKVGLEELHLESDWSAGRDAESFIYIFRKS